MAWCFCICYRISKLHFSPSMDTDTRHCHQAKKNPLSANLQKPNRSGGGVRSSTSNFCFNVLILRKKCLLQEKVAPPPNATCLHKTLIHMF